MHYEVYFYNHRFPGLRPYYNPLVFACFDVLWITFLFAILSFRHRKLAYSLSYAFILIIAIANIVYSRFFGDYLTLSALGELNNFRGLWWLPYLSESFRWSDLLLSATTVLALIIILKLGCRKICLLCFAGIIILISAFHLTIGTSFINYVPLSQYWDYKKWFAENVGGAFNYSFLSDQKRIISHCGVVRSQILCNLFFGNSNQELSMTDVEEILRFYNERQDLLGEVCSPKMKSKDTRGKDVVFILVESYLSIASTSGNNMPDITPNINKLIEENDCYFNLNVKSNRGAGESIDAQISYFTGYIPLRKQISIPFILRNTVDGIPSLLRKQKGYSTYMTLPSSPNFWHQSELNSKLGIDNLFALGWTNDSILFSEVIKEQAKLQSPYFHVIVTISMHGTYGDSDMPESSINYPFKFPDDYSKEFQNYLKKCYYTDYQIGRYIDYLKSIGKYDDTIFVIVSDHEAHDFLLKMTKEKLNDLRLPFIILHSGLDFSDVTKEEINQVDIYPTLIDMFGLKSCWMGLGNSILREGYYNEMSDSLYDMSEKIIRGNGLKYIKKSFYK